LKTNLSLSSIILLLILGFLTRGEGKLLPPSFIPTGDPNRPDAKLYLPDNKEIEKIPLIVLLHGFSSSGKSLEDYLQIKANISSEAVAILIPEGRSDSKGRQYWNATSACCDKDHKGVNDALYLNKLMSAVKLTNPSLRDGKTFLVGHSNGGFMAHRLACDFNQSIDGIISISGGSFLQEQECRYRYPIKYLHIHSVKDPAVKYFQNPDMPYSGAYEDVAMMVRRNKCFAASTKESRFDFISSLWGAESKVQLWSPCSNNTSVEFISIEGEANATFNPHVPELNKIKFIQSLFKFIFNSF